MVAINESQSPLHRSNKKSSSTPITLSSSVESPESKSSVAAPLEGDSVVKATDQLCLIASSMSCDDWRGALTTFDGFTNTRPDGEFENISWDEVCNHLCPKEPKIIAEKRLARYVVPCLLKDAPLVGKTLETARGNGQSTIGKMRSKSHVTKAAMLIMDIDGLPKAEFNAVLKKIARDGIAYLAYTTFSHGSPNKPGMRARIVIPIDRQLTADEYSIAWHGFDQHYWQGQAGMADSSGAYLHQQQSTWFCHPSRVDKAKSRINKGVVVSADVLIEIGCHAQARQSPKSRSSTQVNSSSGDKVVYPPSDANKVADRCRQIGAFRDSKGIGQSEPLWRDCLGVVGYCMDSEVFCHKWSSGHEGYNEQETVKKLDARMRFPPTTCDQFRRTKPAGCEGCVQSCNSPITLGQEDDEQFEDLVSETEIIGPEKPLVDKEDANTGTTNSTLAPSPVIQKHDGESEATLGTNESDDSETKKLSETPSHSVVPIKHTENTDGVKRGESYRVSQNALDEAQPLDQTSFPNKRSQGSHQVPATIPNVRHLIESYKIIVRYNIIRKKLMITIPGYSGMPDNADNSAITYIVSLATLNSMQIGQLKNYIEVIADQNPYNPIAEWINSKPWDDKDRIQDICDTLVHRSDYPEKLKIILLRKWLLSTVAAALKPNGFKSRGVLTIQGPQSIGKTGWVNALIPDSALREIAILLDHHLDAGNKDSIITAVSHWIVEIGELDSSFKKDIARLKGFLTSDRDKVRRPYGAADSEYPRRTVFCATVNDDNFLVDATGNTRWWTIPVIKINYEHNIDMQQLYAQLAVDFHAGKQWWLTPEEEKLLEKHNADHRVISVIREKVLGIIDPDHTNNAKLSPMTPLELLSEIGIEKPTNPQCKECAAVLRELLGDPKRIKGKNKWRIPVKMNQFNTLDIDDEINDDEPIDSNN